MSNLPSQICLIGDKSGDRAGQGKVVLWRRQSSDVLAVCGRTLSCRKNSSWEPCLEEQHTWLKDVINIPLGLSLCHGSILGVTVYRKQSGTQHQLWVSFSIWFHSAAVQSRRARQRSKLRHQWVGVIGSNLMGTGTPDVLHPDA
ncbi:hypothetical protein TNCV_243791 [Trichonephila clavipes]|nr:hypothetical protein TNCV_243791 [Trichonephila clavipes]